MSIAGSPSRRAAGAALFALTAVQAALCGVAVTTLLQPGLAAAAEAPRAKHMVNVRAAPDLGSRIVAVLKKGDAPTVLAAQGEFVKVKTAGGVVGYLRPRNLEGYAPPAAAPVPPVARAAEPAIAPYRSPYPARTLEGFAPLANRSGAAVAPITPLSAGKPSPWQVTVGLGATISAQNNDELRRELRRDGFDGQITDLNQSAPGGFVRFSYGTDTPYRLEAALVYLGDLDLRLNSAATTEAEVVRLVDEHAVATGLGLAPTLAYQWRRPDRALTVRGGGFIGLGAAHDLELNGNKVQRDDGQDGALAGLSWEQRHNAGVWTGVDAQVMYLNDWVGLLSLTARWGE